MQILSKWLVLLDQGNKATPWNLYFAKSEGHVEFHRLSLFFCLQAHPQWKKAILYSNDIDD